MSQRFTSPLRDRTHVPATRFRGKTRVPSPKSHVHQRFTNCDRPYPSKSSLDPGLHVRPGAFGKGLDRISSSNSPSIPSVAPGSSCASRHAKSPYSRASAVPTDTVSPVPQGADAYRTVERPFLPPFPTSCSPAHSHRLDSIIPPGLPPIQTILDMTLGGQHITFNLEGLDVDPHSIIELLRSTSSDRDKWMIVGASYRRKGNTHAALTVVATMVQVLNDLGLKACELRPAFLMLSSCHTELWRRTRAQDGSETETSVAHLDMSRRWLQLVYGLGSEDSPDTLVAVDNTSRHAHDVPPEHGDITLGNIQRAYSIRDLRVLRDSPLDAEDLANLRCAKRRLEDEIGSERATRRRLERTLHHLEAKVVQAQKRADDAHSLVRVEVKSRRRSEQAISEERAKRRTMEVSLERQAQSAKPLLDELAALFFRNQGCN